MLNKIFFVLLSIFAFSFSQNAFSAKFYKWTDEDGNTHYSDKVPDGETDTETVQVNTLKPSKTEHSLPEYTAGETKELSKEQKEELKKQEENLIEVCNGLRSNIASLEKGGNIQILDDEGNQKSLNKEEQDAKLKQYKTQLDKNCTPS